MLMRNGKAEVDLEGVATNMKSFAAQRDPFSVAVCGGSGEFYELTEEERRRALAAAAREKGNRLLLGGVGGDTTKATVASAQAAEEAGADVLLLMPSEVIARKGEAVLLNLYLEVAKSVSIGVIGFS